ncbi:MAG: M28 family peptidase, partial [Myxococcales bacterium]|nr:M28 family peptidase [Myxococcales bacterium]
MFWWWTWWGCGQVQPAPVDPVACFSELATALSTDEMGGRGAGTPGLEAAARLLEERHRAAGLAEPPGGRGQPFQAVTGVTRGPENRLDDLVLDTDWGPLGFSSSGAFEGDVVFAGYGIVAKDLGYDDYAGVDVKGRVVLAMRYEPREDDEESPFDGRKASRWSELRYKALKAREAGAVALVFVSPARSDGEPDRIPPMVVHGSRSRAGLPVLQVTRAVADRWLAAAGTDLASERARIDADLKPVSRVLPGVRATGHVDVVPTEATVRNLIGVIPGEGALKDEVVVVGAHYDHLGLGEQGSMRPDSHEIHNGADDNASGTAAVICAVSELARQPPPGPRRTVVAIDFAGEELGLLGSAWYVDHPAFPLERTVAMV